MGHTNQRALRVFIADDSKVVRDRLRNLLSDLARIELAGEAADGQQALDEIRGLRPDAVILDISMPRMNGIQLLEKLREDGVPVALIVLTAHASPEYRDRCVKAGANFFLRKAQDLYKLEGILGGLAARLQS